MEAYLKDTNFLEELDSKRIRTIYSKITVLDWQERPVQEIQGLVTAGSVSISGSSSTRRTANITILVKDEDFNILDIDNLISINKKIKLEIGVKNNTSYYTEYPILWFPQGIYVIITPSISRSSSGTTISLQLQDKMCLLNGTCGGIIPASTRFDEYDDVDDDGNYVTLKPTIYEIIQEAVNHFGCEQLSKIIIGDLDSRVKRIMKWTSETPLYVYKNNNSWIVTLDEPDDDTAIKYEYGEDVGYIYTDFTYPSELTVNAGGKVTDVLDNIVKTLGNYEYFYDLDGNFVFQEIKNYLNTTESTTILEKIKDSNYAIDRTSGKSVYVFGPQTNLITSYSNSPLYTNIKNDFVVWGKRKVSSDTSIPIRYHLSIDNKPTIGNSYIVILDEDNKVISAYKETEVNALPTSNIDSNLVYKYNNVYYRRKFTTDNIGYWDILTDVKTIITNDWRTELYLQGVMASPRGIDSNFYYTELEAEWPSIFDLENNTFFDGIESGTTSLDFFLDFIDSQNNISKFNVNSIGRRTMVVNDDTINCIFARDIPDVILIETGTDDTESLREEAIEKGQEYYQVDTNIYSCLANGGNQNAAYDYIKDLLYQYTNYNESITLQTIPIYHLDVNTRITVDDNKSNIHGDYIIKSISVPLEAGGTMSISASKALQKI